ncbi:MAG: winged helix-turn-helix domain-containing protein [Clostridiales bacterium]|jgi:Mor family transcriptional regulator|nr:winged helix-turn-helix domain-containing protein [Clostridiales bacterium]
MDSTEFLKDAAIDDLPEPYKGYALAIGIENLYKLSELTGGKNIYVATTKRLFATHIKRRIAEEYWRGGVTQEQLSEKYGIERSTVTSHIKEMKQRKE